MLATVNENSVPMSNAIKSCNTLRVRLVESAIDNFKNKSKYIFKKKKKNNTCNLNNSLLSGMVW